MSKLLGAFGIALVAIVCLHGTLAGAMQTQPAALPNKTGSFKFAVLGNTGTGDPAQYELAEQAARVREAFKFDHVILIGGNIQGSERPQDYVKKFEAPYKKLLDNNVTFHAALGRDDSREQRFYKSFNMGGKTYYTFSPSPEVQFFALDSTHLVPEQFQWLEGELRSSKAPWKIAFFHHPLYSTGGATDETPPGILDPILRRHNVSVIFSGRDRFYERSTPQGGVTQFMVGSGGQVESRRGDRRTSAKAFDKDLAFLVVEITGDELHFYAVSRSGEIVDSGVVHRTPK